MGTGPIGPHQVQLGCLIRLDSVVEADVRHPRTICCNGGTAVRPAPVRQLGDAAVADRHGVDFALPPLVFPIRTAIRGEQDRAAVGHPDGSPMVEIARRDLPRHATVGRDDKDVVVAGFDESAAVRLVPHACLHARGLCPLCALGSGRHRCEVRRRFGHEHGKSDPASVG